MLDRIINVFEEIESEGICVVEKNKVLYCNCRMKSINPCIYAGMDLSMFYNEEVDIYFSIKENKRYYIKKIYINKYKFILVYKQSKGFDGSNVNTNSHSREEFYKTSHDLKSPLTAILSLSEFFVNENKNSKQYDYAVRIKKNAEYTLKLIDDILKNAKNEYIEERGFNIRKTVIEAVEICMASAQAKSQHIRTDAGKDDFLLIGDEIKVKRLIINILSNAVKYTQIGGEITVLLSIESIAQGKYLSHISVKDNGIGIDKEFIDKLFLPFEKNTENGEYSTGLGLSFAKKTAEELGGRLYAESKKGKGSVFTAEIPFIGI